MSTNDIEDQQHKTKYVHDEIDKVFVDINQRILTFKRYQYKPILLISISLSTPKLIDMVPLYCAQWSMTLKHDRVNICNKMVKSKPT